MDGKMKNVRKVLDLDCVFANNEVLKDFIIEIIEIYDKINEETKFDFIIFSILYY